MQMKTLFLISVFFIFTLKTFSQSNISGKITDEDGKALTGASIYLQHTYKGTYSDINGNYILKKIHNGKYKISVSYLGYKSIIKEINLQKDLKMDFQLEKKDLMSDEVIIIATRTNEKSPTSHTNIDKKHIEENNLAQDVPLLLKMTPSLVTSSDAGAGVGYTSFRIRGTDINRINVTVDGIPLNDAESHGVWWVDLPDIAANVDNIQIQRGVGTSTNGAGAFGATVNLQTITPNVKPYGIISSTYGSFNTLKNSLKVGSGLIDGKFTFDARLSKISSDGYIDRAFSNLSSYYLSGGYYGEKTILKLTMFSGKERTYQAWFGIPKVRLENDMEGMLRYQEHWLFSEEETQHMINSGNRTYNYYTYDNEVDNYRQDHYRLIFSREINSKINLNAALHLTRGLGYYESYKKDRNLMSYGIEVNPADFNLNELGIYIQDTVINYKTDLIQRKWLDNYFYGATYSLNYKYKKVLATLGGSINEYDGEHYGNIIWARYASNSEMNYEWYRSRGIKKDFNVFGKINYQITEKLNLYGDLQYRYIDYIISGIDDDLAQLAHHNKYNFLNPKTGLFYQLNNNQNIYISYAIANREPTRSNFVDADEDKTPKHETLYDYEAGYNFNKTNMMFAVNLFYMDYNNQLVLTGEINNVGTPIMVNVAESYRRGVEIQAGVKPVEKLQIDINATYSQNEIKNFTEYVDDWDNWGQQIATYLGTTNLSFSPSIICGGRISYTLIKNLKLSIISKYVGKQFIDNTSNPGQMLDAYFVNDAHISYTIKTNTIKEINFNLIVNNIFSEQYETNAWVYRYYTGGKFYNMDGYFPQAGINFLAGVTMKF